MVAQKLAHHLPEVLIVEDCDDLGKLMQWRLERACCKCVLAGSLAEAREALRTQHFDVMLLDIFLPDGLGNDLLDDVDQMPPIERPKVFVTSGNAADHLHTDVRVSGVYEKPFEFAHLLQAILRAME